MSKRENAIYVGSSTVYKSYPFTDDEIIMLKAMISVFKEKNNNFNFVLLNNRENELIKEYRKTPIHLRNNILPISITDFEYYRAKAYCESVSINSIKMLNSPNNYIQKIIKIDPPEYKNSFGTNYYNHDSLHKLFCVNMLNLPHPHIIDYIKYFLPNSFSQDELELINEIKSGFYYPQLIFPIGHFIILNKKENELINKYRNTPNRIWVIYNNRISCKTKEAETFMTTRNNQCLSTTTAYDESNSNYSNYIVVRNYPIEIVRDKDSEFLKILPRYSSATYCYEKNETKFNKYNGRRTIVKKLISDGISGLSFSYTEESYFLNVPIFYSIVAIQHGKFFTVTIKKDLSSKTMKYSWWKVKTMMNENKKLDYVTKYIKDNPRKLGNESKNNDLVSKRAKKFSRLIVERYAKKNLPVQILIRKAHKYKIKYKISDKEFAFFKKIIQSLINKN